VDLISLTGSGVLTSFDGSVCRFDNSGLVFWYLSNQSKKTVTIDILLNGDISACVLMSSVSGYGVHPSGVDLTELFLES
jgi:hypothetical protein